MKKNLLYYLFLILVLALTLYSISGSQSLSELGQVLALAQPGYVAAGIILMSSFWIWDALIIRYLSRHTGIDCTLGTCLRYALIGQYYNFITPMASGGLPVQVYVMSQRGPYAVAEAGSILVNKWIVFQSMITLYGLFFLVYDFSFVISLTSGVYVWVFIGLLLNLVMMPAILILAYNQNALLKTMRMMAALPGKLRLSRWVGPERIEEGIVKFVDDLNRMHKSPRMVFNVALLTFSQLACYFSISYCVYRGLGQNSLDFIQVIAIQAILYTAIHFIPTPGNAGTSEGAFYILFKSFFPAQLIYAGLILWRILVFYFGFLVTGLATVYDHAVLARRPGVIKEPSA